MWSANDLRLGSACLWICCLAAITAIKICCFAGIEAGITLTHFAASAIYGQAVFFGKDGVGFAVHVDVSRAGPIAADIMLLHCV